MIPDLVDYLIENAVKAQNIYDPPKRANGDSWGFVGYEVTELPEEIVMGHNGCGNEQNMFWTYKYNDYSLWNQCGEPKYEEVMLMCDCIRKKRLTTSISDTEKRVWDNIEGRFVHSSENGEIVPDVLVITIEDLSRIHQFFREHKNYGKLIQKHYRIV